MKKIILFIVIILSANKTIAQDKIYKMDGTEIQVKITEISEKEIKYKKFSNLDGPLFIISKNEVLMIVYQNGESEVINKKEEKKKSSEIDFKKLDRYARGKDTVDFKKKSIKIKYIRKYGQNTLSINAIPIAFKSINFEYKFFVAKQHLAIGIPVFIRYLSSGIIKNDTISPDSKLQYFNLYFHGSGDYFRQTKYYLDNVNSVGLNISYYPFQEGKIQPYIKLGGEYDMVYISEITKFISGRTFINKYKYNVGGFTFGLGTNYQITKYLFFGLEFGFRILEYEKGKLLNNSGFNLGLRI